MMGPQDYKENEFIKNSQKKRASHVLITIKEDLRDENHSIHQTRSLKRGSLKPTPLSSYKERGGYNVYVYSFHISPCKNYYHK